MNSETDKIEKKYQPSDSSIRSRDSNYKLEDYNRFDKKKDTVSQRQSDESSIDDKKNLNGSPQDQKI